MQVKGYGTANRNGRKATNGNARKGRNVHSKKLKILLGVLGTLVAGFIVVAILLGVELTSDDYGSLFVASQPAANIDGDSDNENNIIDAPVQTHQNEVITYNGKTYKKNDAIVNLLFLGIDSNDEREAQQMGYRSDMIMVCAVDTASKTATLLSVPRDTYTDVYKIGKDGSIEKTVKEKLNAAYSYGGGPRKYGASNSKACLQKFLERECDLQTPLDFTLDIPIPFYASIDMDGITKIAKAVDGVEVTLDQSIPNVGSKGKTVTLKGSNAEEYLRNRHDSDGSDFGRTSHQRTFMIALAKKIKSMGAVDAVTKLWDEFSEFGKTDLSIDQALDFAKILNGVNIDAIQQLTIPGESKMVDGSSVVVTDEAATLEMLLSIYYTEV